MNDQSVSIALYIKDRNAQLLTRSMFESAGARILLCDDTAAIQATASRAQAIVLGLAGSPENAIDAVVMLRKRLTTMPIYVLADHMGERHSKRIRAVGATEVILHAELQQRAPQLVSQLAGSAQAEGQVTPSPGWPPTAMDEGYDVESMDLETWMAIPGNRERLLGMAKSVTKPDVSARGPENMGRHPDAAGSSATQARSTPPATTASATNGMRPPGLGLGNAQDSQESKDQPAYDFADFPLLIKCRKEHAEQNNAILDAHKQREKRLQAAIKVELHRAIAERITASEAKTLQRIDEGVSEVRREIAAAVRRTNFMIGGMFGLVVILAVVFGWRMGG